MFSEKLLQHPNVKTKLGHGLSMMSRSVSGVQVSYAPAENAKQTEQQQQQSVATEAFEMLRVSFFRYFFDSTKKST